MERKRTSSRFKCEEEQYTDRRINPRGGKRVRYTEDYSDYDDEVELDDEYEDEDEDEYEEDNEQPGTSTQNTHNQRRQETRLLTVTCGNKKGILDIEKLGRGEECIQCQDCWFSPPAFEEFGGKGSSKKWKTSIFYDNKPLQFLFEQGSLTTKGFKRRSTTKKTTSSRGTSESSSEVSEIQSAEENEDDDVKDEDWLPGSEELVLETEEEGVGTAHGGEVVDSGVDTSKEEEDQMEEGEMEDEDNGSNVFEERETKLIISTPEKSALQKQVKIVIKRLPEEKTDFWSNCSKHNTQDSWCKPLDADALNEEKSQHSVCATDDSSITASTNTDPSWVSEQPTVGGAEEENREEFTQSDDRKEDRQKEIKTKTEKSLTLPFAPEITSSPEIKPETKDIGPTSKHTACLTSSSALQKTQSQQIIDSKDYENANDEHADMSISEASGPVSENGNISAATSPIQRSIKEESIEAMYGGAAKKSLSGLVDCENTDASNFGHDVAGLKAVKLVVRVLQASQASDAVEAPSSGPSTSCDLDTMDLDQLRREKLKMQIKVLKLQEEYYTQKIKDNKK
uniref:uncharacterized protein LOC124073275 isoform X2 n=1 Tax=Scatophagus argus TaxID=75038 RepID=UPI001ED8134E|nr:uncharacterized protein LOC124073275 isoform X2 [Scatophagus argus]